MLRIIITVTVYLSLVWSLVVMLLRWPAGRADDDEMMKWWCKCFSLWYLSSQLSGVRTQIKFQRKWAVSWPPVRLPVAPRRYIYWTLIVPGWRVSSQSNSCNFKHNLFLLWFSIIITNIHTKNAETPDWSLAENEVFVIFTWEWNVFTGRAKWN